jgi:hypothetical protein
MRFRLAIAICLMPLATVQGCATQSEASRAAEQAAEESEDAATCRERSGEEDDKAYEACRKAMAEARTEKAAVQEQKRRDFDRVLGAGTDGASGY